MRQTLQGMAKGLLAAACILLHPALTDTASAQTPVTIGNPLSTSYTYQLPVNSLYNYSYTQQILLSSDIGMSGTISKIRFKHHSGTLVYNDNWTVYLGYKTGSTFTSTTNWVPLSSLTNVYSGTVTATGGWVELTLSTPFSYNMATGNLVIAVDENSSDYSYDSEMFPINASGTDYRALYYRSDGTNPNPATPPTATGRLQYFNTIQLEITGPPCTGTPVAALTSSIPGPVCVGQSFVLSAAPIGLDGLSYRFQSSADGTTWNDLAPASSAFTYVVASQSAPTQYRVIVMCATGSASDTSAVVSIGQNAPLDCYCTPATGSGATSYINSFSTTGGITNISKTSGGASSGYSDFHTTDAASAYAGTVINYSIGLSTSSSYGRAVWIDLNENGFFEPSERVANSTSYAYSPLTGSFTIPMGTTPGTKRLRVLAALSNSNPNNACAESGSGEYEDYNFVVVPLPMCTGIPDPGATYASNTSICTGNTVKLGVENNPMVSGLSYEWYASTDGGTTWTLIAGATDSVYMASPVLNTTYKAIATCAGSGDTASATPVAIGFNTNITSVTPGEVCTEGTVDLAATGPAGATINWYDAATGGTVLATGATFTTPSITTTTTYYAEPVMEGSGDITVGAGTMTSVSGSSEYSGKSPFAYHYGNYKHQMLIRASELSAAGMMPGPINNLSFVVTGTYGGTTPYAVFNNFTISLKQTTATAMTSTFETGTTVVYTGNYTPVTGTNTFTFSTPFVWDGVSSIIVQTCYNNNNSGVVDASAEVLCDNTSFVSHTIYRADGTHGDICTETSGNSSNDGPIISNRPKIILGVEGTCAGPRVPVVATVSEPVTIDLGADTTICTSSPITLDAGIADATYTWSTGDNTQTISVSAGGTYSVDVTAGACTSTGSITISEVPAPVAGTITATVTTMPAFDFSAAGTTGASDYVWDFGDGTVVNTATASHAYTANGVYEVMFIATNACGESDTSTTTVTVSGVGINTVNGTSANVQVYPNPSNGLTVVEAKGALISNIEVMDNLGRIVLHTTPNTAKAVIDVKGMAQGIYTLRVHTGKGISTVKLVVKD